MVSMVVMEEADAEMLGKPQKETPKQSNKLSNESEGRRARGMTRRETNHEK